MVANHELISRLSKAFRDSQEVLLRDTLARANAHPDKPPAINLNFPEGVIRVDEGRVAEEIKGAVTDTLAIRLREEMTAFIAAREAQMREAARRDSETLTEALQKVLGIHHSQIIGALAGVLTEALAKAPAPQVTVQPPAVNVAPQIDMEKLLQTVGQLVKSTIQGCFQELAQQRVGMKSVTYQTETGERETITVEVR